MPQIILDDPDNTLEMLRDSVARLSEKSDGAAIFRQRRADQADISPDLWQEMAQAGWLGLMLPETMGGAELGVAELAVMAEAFGRNLVTEPYAMLAVLPTILLSNIKPSDKAGELATGISDGSRIVPLLWLNAQGAKRALTLDTRDGALSLSGRAEFVDAARSATDFLVLCTMGDETVLTHLPADADGITITERPAIDGTMIGAVTLENISVPDDRILARGEMVESALAQAVQIARLALAAELAGLGERAMELTVDYTKERVQFGKPLASFQVLQHRMVDMWSDAEFACSAVANAVTAVTEAPEDEAALAVLAAKARAGDASVAIGRRALHLHGAMGFTDECDIGLYLKRSIALNAILGSAEELRLDFVARESKHSKEAK